MITRLHGGYKNLIGIDDAYCLMSLTAGVVLRFNPTHVNDQIIIDEYLNKSKSNNKVISIIGSQLIKVN
jgi:hypothetical protein